MLGITSSFSRLAFNVLQPVGRGFHTASPLCFQLSCVDNATMTKRKTKKDPNQQRGKDDRRRRKLAKALRKMEKKDRQPRPIAEIEVPPELMKEMMMRKRDLPVSEEVKEERIYLLKDWARFAGTRYKNEIWFQDRLLTSQQRALDQLRNESEELYVEAIQFDPSLVPFQFRGPTQTPAIPGFIQDGSYEETTRKFEVVYDDMETFLKQITARTRKTKKKKHDDDED